MSRLNRSHLGSDIWGSIAKQAQEAWADPETQNTLINALAPPTPNQLPVGPEPTPAVVAPAPKPAGMGATPWIIGAVSLGAVWWFFLRKKKAGKKS